MSFLGSVVTWLNGPPQQRRGVRALQIAIGAVLLARVMTEVRFADYLWGANGLGASGGSGLFAGLLDPWVAGLFSLPYAPFFVEGLLAVAALGLVTGRWTRVATLGAFVAALALELRLPLLTDGGDNVMRLVLFYMLCLVPARSEAPAGGWRAWLHNLGLVAIGAQIFVIYIVSGMMKAGGAAWHNGTALYTISQVDWFSDPSLRPLFTNPWITTFATYSAMLFQLWFPFAIFTRAKLVWLALGIGMHLGILTFMGLIHFSTVMIGLELFLVTDLEWERLWAGARRLLRLSQDGAARYLVFIDGDCAVCRATQARLHAFDGFAAVETSSFRHEPRFEAHGLAAAALEERMHVLDRRTGRVTAGFAAVQTVLAALPILWPLRPLAAVFALAGVGERAYLALARRRLVVTCAAGCAVPARGNG